MTNLEVLVIAVATLFGPILAVQAQKFIERTTESRRRKQNIFYSLMSTRAMRVSSEHVQALNMIDLAFSTNSRNDKNVVRAWKDYADQLNEKFPETEVAITHWNARCDDLFVDLLFALSGALGFKFDKVQLRRGVYYPRAHGETEQRQRRIEIGLETVLSGERPIAMEVVSFPVDEKVAALQVEAQKAMIDTVTGERPMQIILARRPRIDRIKEKES